MPKSSSLGSTLLVTTILALGIAAVWLAAMRWCSSLIESNQPNAYENLALGPNGEPLIQRYSRVGTFNAFQPEQILTLNGEPASVHPDTVYGEEYIEGNDRFVPNTPLHWWQRLAGFNDGGTPAIYWYLVHDGHIPGRAYGVGYHSKAKTTVGYFSQGGFTPSMPPHDQWFHFSGELRGLTTATVNASEPQYGVSEPIFLLADGKLWKVDGARRQVKAVVDCPAAYALGATWQIPDKSQISDTPATLPDEPDDQPKMPENTDRVAVRQPDNLIVFDKRTNKHTSFQLPAKVRDMGISTWVLPDGNLALITPADEEKNLLPELMWLDPEGNVLKQQTVRLTSQDARRLPIPEVWRENIRVAVPLNKVLLFAYWTHIEAQRATPPSYAVGFGKVFKRGWLAALILFLACVPPAWLAYRRQKRFGLPHAGIWAAFTFIFGVPGWIAYRFHRTWPVLEDCPACHQASPRDRETCIDCGAAFNPPPLKGIEVFA